MSEQQKPWWKKQDKQKLRFLERVNKMKRIFVQKHEIDFNFIAALPPVKRMFWLDKLQSRTGMTENDYIKFLTAQEEWKDAKK